MHITARLADAGTTLGSEAARDNLLDLWRGLRLVRLWAAVAWLDVEQRYRRSVLGSLWITISLGVMIGGMGFVFAILFGQDPQQYLPYLGASMVGWNLMVTMVNEGAEVFIGSRGLLLQYNAPTSVYVFKFLSKIAINFLHSFIVVIILIAVFDVPVGYTTLLFIPAVLIFIVNGFWATIVVGFLSLKYRDLPFIVSSAMQIIFFMTPVFWRIEDLGDNTFIFIYNPFYHFLETFRQPVLGSVPSMTSYLAVLVVTALGLGLGLAVWAYRRHRIHYYL